QGVYPCAGDDRWVAISVTSDQDWRLLCEAVGLADEWRGLSLEERRSGHDEIDEAITRWTRGQTPRGVMTRLQERGVIATQVSDARDLVEDPHLAARDFWAAIDQPDVGPRSYPGNAIRLSRNPVMYRRPAPTLGQHNDEILGGELGVPAEELARLREIGAIGEAPPPA
ncbi:MAG TPA: CoA transferase, partial [Dehalococcoidia bacterium]|nr:CoA transferase [Dehalococcoidia bacterium]